MNSSYNALIVGAGNIGAFFDNPTEQRIITHAHGYQKHNKFNLVGFVDSDFLKAQQAAKIWKSNAFKSIEGAFNSTNIDVVSICTPDDTHYETIKKVDAYKPKLIFLEKPLASNIEMATDILKTIKTPILINYSRRFVEEFYCLIGSFGEFKSGVGFYGKGFKHNGSHMIDFIRYFIPNKIRDCCVLNEIADFYQEDKSVDCVLNFDNGAKFNMVAVDCRDFTIFEMDFIFKKGRIRILNSGLNIEIYELVDNQLFPGYKNLKLVKKVRTSLDQAMYFAIDSIYKYLSKSTPLKCTIEDGFSALEICNLAKKHD